MSGQLSVERDALMSNHPSTEVDAPMVDSSPEYYIVKGNSIMSVTTNLQGRKEAANT